MRHTDFDTKLKEIKELEFSELRAAIKAHGGRFSFEEADIDQPIVATYGSEWNDVHPIDLAVQTVFLKDDSIIIQGTNAESCNEEEINASDVIEGHLQYIIEYMPEPPGENLTVRMLFGDVFILAFCDERDKLSPNTILSNHDLIELERKIGGGEFITHTFQTVGEKIAYLQAIEDHGGWHSACNVDEK